MNATAARLGWLGTGRMGAAMAGRLGIGLRDSDFFRSTIGKPVSPGWLGRTDHVAAGIRAHA
jgi:hypothetical protein